MFFSIKKSSLLAVFALSSVAACSPTPQDILSAHPWQCGSNVTMTFKDGIVATMLNNASPAMEFRSSYRVVQADAGQLTRMQLDDDKSMRPLFGGSTPLNVIDVAYVDLHLVLTARGMTEICAPLRGPE